jgi:hypothetical protein
MKLKETHFQVAKMSNSASHEASCPGVEDFMTRPKLHFQAVKMMKSRSPEDMNSTAKCFMTLEEFHF